MERPREFDQETALQQAMELFWEKGFERTSIQDLVDRTANVKAPKASPADIAKIAIDGVEADNYEIVADEFSSNVQRDFAGGVQALYPQLFQQN
ncbi:hypothetical protein POTG_03828 [Paenibacillus sp. oral taxon 786 str. D14]|nr:hypothetical protein POTG_03828 [Paenibacillus sp. oral taxon 786 str. D14]